MTNLPEWGILGAFVAVVVTLVVLFLNHIRERDKILIDIHNNCENRIALMTDRCLTVIEKNTQAYAELKSEVRALTR